MADRAELIASYEAQAALNTSAITAFNTLYPHIEVGYRFEDSDAIEWEITQVYASKGYPVVMKAYVSGEDVTNYTNMVLNFAGVPEPID